MPPTDRVDAAGDELIAFLEDPSSYPHAPDHVRLLQTHISFVAIASPFVYKVKKPVDLGFADFSTLEKRRHYCEQEVRLNSRLCPHVYEDVVPIFRSGGRLTFEGEGEVAAYAVRMKELTGGHYLHEKLDDERLTRGDLQRVAERLESFYRERTATPETARWGRTGRLRISTDENFEQTAGYVGEVLSRPAYEAVRYFTDRFYDQQAALLNRRRAEGHVIDGHGDLRLEHVYVTPERVCIYDCIEFSDRLRYVDVASDVAFLAMDLDYQGRPDLGQVFVRQMAAALDDPDVLALADFYKCYRAYVRGKVEGLRSAEEEVPADERAGSRDRARRYFELAVQYAVAGSGPAVIVVMGGVGTGKSTQAQALGRVMGWDVISSDQVRKELANTPLYERGTDEQRQALYTKEMTEKTYDGLQQRAVERARRGRGTVLDATFSRRGQRDRLRRVLRAEGVPHCFVEVTAPPGLVRQRLEDRDDGRTLSDAREEDLEVLDARYEAPDDLEDTYHFTESTEDGLETTTLAILKHLTRLDL